PPPPGPHYWRKSMSNIHFVGEGESSIIQFENPGISSATDYNSKFPYTQGWAFPAPTNISLRGLAFTWNPIFMLRDGRPWYTLVIDAGDGAQLIGLLVDGGQPGLWIPGGRDKWAVDCVVRNTAADAIHFQGATDSVGAYNYVENANDDGLANFTNTLDTPDTTKIGNVRFAYNTVLLSGWGRGLTFGGSDQTMDHNWVEAQVEAGIYTDVGIFDGAPPAALINAVARDNTLVRTNLAQREDNFFFGFGTGGYQGAIAVRDEVQSMRIERNQIYGSGVHGMTFGIEGWRPLDGSALVLSDNRLESELGAGVRFISTAAADGVEIEGNRIIDTGAASVLVEGALHGVETADNKVTTAPSVSGTVDGDFSGFTVVDDKPAYRDVYHDFRVAPDETGWETAPTRAGLARPAAVADVGAFGARGDGRTNDTAAFNRALDSLPARGGVLRIPAGHFVLRPVPGHDTFPYTRIRHHLLVTGRDNVHIEGAGDSSVLVFTSPEHQGIRFIGVGNSSISAVRLELATQRPLRRNRALLELSGVRSSVVEDVTVVGSSGPGILVDSSRLVAVRNATVRAAGTHGVEVAASRQVLVETCTINDARDNGLFLGWLGSIACAPQFVRLAGNTVSSTREGGGITLIGGDQVVVSGNQIGGTYLAGIYLYSRCGNFPHRRIEVSGNTLTGTNTGRLSYTPGAIALQSLQRGRSSADVLVADNAVRQTPYAGIWVGGPTPLGTKLADLQRLEIRGNDITDAGGQPLDISDAQRGHIDELVIT
ncbi:MAG TPA: right-handed parallel beta-helix repeat-containing protein, partial [Actinopolymorphaceae bacterium]|nr:right-handed parallel beta-helix repeat-containing protein [Actinopolymorphaceae bacterium]